jgi:hypothetical protein
MTNDPKLGPNAAASDTAKQTDTAKQATPQNAKPEAIVTPAAAAIEPKKI